MSSTAAAATPNAAGQPLASNGAGRQIPKDAWLAQRPDLAAHPHVVIVGGGFGGLGAARALAKERVRITLVDRRNHHLFQPLLYQVAMAGLSPADIAMPIRTVFRGEDNVRVLLAETTSVDLARQQLILREGERIDYDYLILAAGARTNYFGHEASWAAHALPLKQLEHALEIRRRVLLAFEAAEREPDPRARQRLLSFVVIGGGPTGVEVAGALAELAKRVLADDFRVAKPEHARVLVLEMSGRLLPGFDEKLAAAAHRQLEQLGVSVRLNSPVEAIDERGVRVGSACIEAATVLWTAGVRAVGLADQLGVELARGGRVRVRGDCSLPNHPDVFVIGDMAHVSVGDDDPPLPGVAPVAMQQGEYVARVIQSKLRGKPAPDAFRYRDRGMLATVGRSRAVLQTSRLRLAGFTAWLLWIVIHVWYLLGFRNRVAVMLNWAWNYLTYRQGARLITGDEDAEGLRRLALTAEGRKVQDVSREQSTWSA